MVTPPKPPDGRPAALQRAVRAGEARYPPCRPRGLPGPAGRQDRRQAGGPGAAVRGLERLSPKNMPERWTRGRRPGNGGRWRWPPLPDGASVPVRRGFPWPPPPGRGSGETAGSGRRSAGEDGGQGPGVGGRGSGGKRQHEGVLPPTPQRGWGSDPAAGRREGYRGNSCPFLSTSSSTVPSMSPAFGGRHPWDTLAVSAVVIWRRRHVPVRPGVPWPPSPGRGSGEDTGSGAWGSGADGGTAGDGGCQGIRRGRQRPSDTVAPGVPPPPHPPQCVARVPALRSGTRATRGETEFPGLPSPTPAEGSVAAGDTEGHGERPKTEVTVLYFGVLPPPPLHTSISRRGGA